VCTHTDGCFFSFYNEINTHVLVIGSNFSYYVIIIENPHDQNLNIQTELYNKRENYLSTEELAKELC
jgi:hypothetical protein